MQSITQSSAVGRRRYFIAVWSVGAALLLTLLLYPLVGPGVSPLFLAAVVWSAWRGSLGVGLLAIALSGLATAFFLLPPVLSLQTGAEDLLRLLVFVLTAVIISSLSATRARAEAALKVCLHENIAGRARAAQEHAARLACEQEARRAAETANELKDEFLATVSHELRTPLTTIKTLTRVLLRGGQSAAQQRQCLEDIASECDRQIDLVLNLLDLSRLKAGVFHLQPEPVEIRALLHECLGIERITAEQRRQLLQSDCPAHLPRLRADRSALRRALCALLENALKYTPEGGVIALRARAADGVAEISVADTGRGIHPDDLPHIFEQFYRGRTDTTEDAEAPGVGLGLYLTRQLIEQCAGSITVASVVGQGSVFTVRLPLWRDAHEEESYAGRGRRPEIKEVGSGQWAVGS